MINSKH